ncbi:CRTAC1 family protein [Flavobacterium fluviatile]|uniref:CRTAC1 family protein n=1 Tax=Flavobacterium fluviatile TaxID=1862387 RepID=UPI0013D03261|nr:CRTAC1 family protein [Flavobacterium fluviatile]
MKFINLTHQTLLTLTLSLLLNSCSSTTNQTLKTPIAVHNEPVEIQYTVEGKTERIVHLKVDSKNNYSNLSLVCDSQILVDNIDIPNAGIVTVNALVDFKTEGEKKIKILKQGGEITLLDIKFNATDIPAIPQFKDISDESGLKTEYTWKYGGPSVGDLNNDGLYDFVLNNHDKVPAKLFWNLGNNKVQEHSEILKQWDIHGSAVGDYDNDGDVDIIIAQGGGNGTDPQPPHLLRNDNGKFTEVSIEAGITHGSRGRAVRWIDMDLDGDLDLLLINAEGINSSSGSQQIIYTNIGNGHFKIAHSKAIEGANAERVLVTDINGDQKDDLILFSPISVWVGNGDLTFTDVTKQWVPENLQKTDLITGACEIDIDNDGDMDIYLSRGKPSYEIANKSLDYNPITKRMDMRDEGNKGITSIDFEAPGDITLSGIFLWYRMYNDGFPLHLGASKKEILDVQEKDTIKVTPEMAKGWPNERKENGWYLGYLGNNKWRLESVRNGNIYWEIRISIDGVQSVHPEWTPQNRNVQDVLFRNDNNHFTDVTTKWNVPLGGNNQGVVAADFNNDSHIDLFVYRFGFLKSSVSDWLLLNNGKGQFETTTLHNAHDPNDPGHGDMGQAFDFNLDGNIDLLNGSDNYGKWYLYDNSLIQNKNYVLVRVNYSDLHHIDPMSATVTVTTPSKSYTKRVGSSGEVFSQSLLNTVHFGLGDDETIKSITVRWRNGETYTAKNLKVNQVYTTP